MCDLTVQFYTTSSRKQRASIMDTHQVIYVSRAEALRLLAGQAYQVGHENNPFRAVLAARMAESDKVKLSQGNGR